MIVYWGSCLISMLMIYFCMESRIGKQHKKAVVCFSALPMIIVAVLRYDVGEDYLYTYVPYFEMLQNNILPSNQKMEIAYHLINQIVLWLGGDYFWVFAICSVLFYVAVFSVIIEESPQPALSVFLLTGMGYVFIFFNTMRQMVGCAILLYSLRYIRKKKFLPFLICIALASGFHYSCVLFIPVYFFDRIKIRPPMALALTILVTILSQLITITAKNLISLTQYSVYFSSIFDTGETAYVMLAIHFILLLFYSVCYREDKEYQFFYNLQMVALWTTAFSGRIVLIIRLLWMFSMPAVISVPVVLKSIPRRKDKELVASVIVLLYVLYNLYTVGLQNSNSVLPYQTIFSRWIA